MSQSEQQTIRKAAAGDRLAFRELVLEHSHAMFRLAWGLTSDQSAADDIVQEAFIKAWRKLDTFKMQSSFHTWLHRITVNAAMDYLRKQARHKSHESPEVQWAQAGQNPEAPKHDVQIDIQTRTHAAMKRLSDTERTALMLRHFEGHSIQEISNIMDLTTNACKQTVFRAVKKMRAELRPLVTT